MMFSLTMLPPIVISLIFDEQSWLPFLKGFGLTLVAGIIIWLPVNRSRKDLRLRDGFVIPACENQVHAGPYWALSVQRRSCSPTAFPCP